MNTLPIAIIAKAALLVSVCCAPCSAQGPVVTTVVAPPVAASTAWAEATYDANGYPIYGYAYGQPVYGYTEAGIAITTIAALTALSYIPNWGPASWYRGPAYAPRGHRYAQPPRYTKGHNPGRRPSAAPRPQAPQGGGGHGGNSHQGGGHQGGGHQGGGGHHGRR